MTFIGVFLGSDFLLELFAAVLIVGAFWSDPDFTDNQELNRSRNPELIAVKNAFKPHPK